MKNNQLILFLLDNSGSMDASFGTAGEIINKVADNYLTGSLGNLVKGFGGRQIERTLSHLVSKVNVLNIAFICALNYFKNFQNSPNFDCYLGVVRYGSNIKELFPTTLLSQIPANQNTTWFYADLGMTNTISAFEWAENEVSKFLNSNPNAPKPWIVHITDGMWNDGGNPYSVATKLLNSSYIFNALIDDNSICNINRQSYSGYSNPSDVQMHFAGNLIEISSRIPDEWIEAVRIIFPNIKVESRLFFPAGNEDLLKSVFEVVKEIYKHVSKNSK